MTLRRFMDIVYLRYVVITPLVMLVVACGGGDGGTGTGAGDTEGGSATLSWTAPSLRADETPLSLSDIAGYRIYYRTENGVYSDKIEISDPSATQAQLSGIPPGKYFVVVTTLDSEGLESAYSLEVNYDL